MPKCEVDIPEFEIIVDEIQRRYEVIRPILLGESTGKDRAENLGIHRNSISNYLKRFGADGMVGLADQYRGPSSHPNWLSVEMKVDILMLKNANPSFSYREIARIVGRKYQREISYKTVQSTLAKAQLYIIHPNKRELIEEQEHIIIRYQTYAEYEPIVAGRYRIIQLLLSDWKISTIGEILQVTRTTIYKWKERFDKDGILGLYSRSTARINFESVITPEDVALIFELVENNPKIGHYRVKMFLNGRGRIIGHTKIWQIISLFREAEKKEKQIREYHEKEDYPLKGNAPHESWFCDVRYLVKLDGKWVYSIMIIDGFSRRILAGDVFMGQNFSCVVSVIKQALIWSGCPLRIVTDNGAVFKAQVLLDAYDQVDITPDYIEKGKPWRNLIESFFGTQYRLLDSYVIDKISLEEIRHQHERFKTDYNQSGHFAHKSKTEDDRIYYQTPDAVMGNAKGRMEPAATIERLLFCKHVTRQVDRYGQIRLDNFVLYVNDGLYGERVDIYVYLEALRIEYQEKVIAEYKCKYDPKQRKLVKVYLRGLIWWCEERNVIPVLFSQRLYRRVALITRRAWTRRYKLADDFQMTLPLAA